MKNEDRYTLEEVMESLEEVFEFHFDGVNSVETQGIADYLNGKGSIPIVKSEDGLFALEYFAEQVEYQYKEQLVNIYFQDWKDYELLEKFFSSFDDYNYLLEPAYKLYLKEKSTADFYKDVDLHSWMFKELLGSWDDLNKLKLEETELEPFGKFIIKEGKETAKVFFEGILATEGKGDYHGRLFINLTFFYQFFPNLLIDNLDRVVLLEEGKLKSADNGPFRSWCIARLLDLDSKTFGPLIEPYLNRITFGYQAARYEFLVLSKLYAYDKKHKDLFLKIINTYIDTFTVVEKFPYGKEGLENKIKAIQDHNFTYESLAVLSAETSIGHEYLIIHCFSALKEISPKLFEERLIDFCTNTHILPRSIIKIGKEHFGQEGMKVLSLIIESPVAFAKGDDFMLKTLLTNLKGFDWSNQADAIWTLALNGSLEDKVLAGELFAEKPIVAKSLIDKWSDGPKKTQKAANMLIFWTLIKLDNTDFDALMWERFHKEKDEQNRSRMLPSIVAKYYQEPLSRKELDSIIQAAADRGSLKKGLKMFDLDKLPALYFKDGKKLNKEQIQFLLYRMKQISRMISDPEAKLLLNHIDKTKSSDFAKAILELFLDKGASAKDKYVMCLAGLLGDDSLLDYLKKLFKELFEANRLKMATYVISTMAMIGSDKALRHVEFISRKYRKKASVETAALEALEDAAEELGIDIYELSDRILPDFGFDGLYKTIEVGAEEMRVFVARNFKLQFITEDNKVRKSLPKAASKALKDELKEVQKEIREVSKAQSDKLEQYMVLERRWTVADWRKFYLMNPVMFIYASNLLWGVYDEQNKLQQVFYVEEDASLLDLEEDEIVLAKGKVGIIHPLKMSEQQLHKWGVKFFDLSISQPFEQLNRNVQERSPDEVGNKGINRYMEKQSKHYGRATMSYFERRGWRKEVVGSGCMNYKKVFKQENIYAYLNLEGLCYGEYYNEVVFYDIVFRKIGVEEWKDESEIPLEKIPKIIFSEVILDMEGIVVKEFEGSIS